MFPECQCVGPIGKETHKDARPPGAPVLPSPAHTLSFSSSQWVFQLSAFLLKQVCAILLLKHLCLLAAPKSNYLACIQDPSEPAFEIPLQYFSHSWTCLMR